MDSSKQSRGTATPKIAQRCALVPLVLGVHVTLIAQEERRAAPSRCSVQLLVEAQNALTHMGTSTPHLAIRTIVLMATSVHL